VRTPDILLVSQVFPPAVGGSGALLHNVYRRLEGIRVTAMIDAATCAGAPAPSGGIHIVKTKVDPAHWGIFDPRGWPGHVALARKIHKVAGDGRALVHCGRAQPEAVPAMLAGLMPNGPRYIFWAHGEDISTTKTSRQFERTMKFVYRRAAGAVANSKNTAAMLEREGIPKAQIAIVYPGVDPDRFKPELHEVSFRERLTGSSGPLLLSVGRLQRRKGHDLVIKAIPALKQRWPKVRYVIVGDGVERESLEHLVHSLGVGDSVTFEGEVSDQLLPNYFSACDVFVMPTRVDGHDFEGFGLVYLEAAAAGKPTIGGRNGGVPEAVEDGVTGMLVSGTSVEELVACVSRLLDSVELRRSMGESGRRRAVEKFSWNAASLTLLDFHRRVAEGDVGKSRR
jgi:phosphatidylinositol alpha-1,6-mannosyltransferase